MTDDKTSSDPSGESDFWEDNPAAWDSVVIGSQAVPPNATRKTPLNLDNAILLPGVAKVTTHFTNAISVNHPPGADGAYYYALGYEPEEFSIELTLWTRDQWDAWKEIRAKKLLPDVTKIQATTDPYSGVARRAATAYPIKHAMLNAHGISAFVVLSIEADQPIAGEAMKIIIECKEWRPAKPRPGTVIAAPPADYVNGALAQPLAPSATPPAPPRR